MINKLMVITGPSGVGKTALTERLMLELELNRCITCTTRAPRRGEIDGKCYNFLSPEVFQGLVKSNEMVEYSQHYQSWYGLRKQDLEQVMLKGPVLLVMNWRGALAVEEMYGASCFFIEPPSMGALKDRLLKRGGDMDRFVHAREDLDQAHQFKLRLVNDDFETCYQQFKQKIQAILIS